MVPRCNWCGLILPVRQGHSLEGPLIAQRQNSPSPAEECVSLAFNLNVSDRSAVLLEPDPSQWPVTSSNRFVDVT